MAIATSTPMMTTTTSSSIRVKPWSPPARFPRTVRGVFGGGPLFPGLGGGGCPGAGVPFHRGGAGNLGGGSAGTADVLVDREHRQVQADDHRPDDGAHEDDHDRLDRRGQ